MMLLLTPALQEELAKSGNVSCVLDENLRLAYCNPAWDHFALKNGGDAAMAKRVVGTQLFDFIPDVLRVFYDQLFEVARATLQMRPHDYECSSPTTYRLFRMEVRPLPSSAGFVVVHALRVEHPHGSDRTSSPPWADRYCNSDGIITMCAHCRKTKHVAEPDVWDWVPEYLGPAAPRARISHGLCGPCFAYFYPRAKAQGR